MEKKRKKKLPLIITAVLAVVMGGVFLVLALGQKKLLKLTFQADKPVKAVNIAIDANTAIDGKRDEKFWNDNTIVFTETKSGIKVTSWAHIGEKGLYYGT